MGVINVLREHAFIREFVNKSRLIFKLRNDYFIEYFFEKMYLNGVKLRKLVGME